MNKDLALDILTYMLFATVCMILYTMVTTGYDRISYDQGFYDGMDELCNSDILIEYNEENKVLYYFCDDINNFNNKVDNSLKFNFSGGIQ